MNGTVTEFDGNAGLGVVTAEGGGDFRFHCVEIADGTRTIDVGASVEFTLLAKLGAYEAACLTKR